MLRPAYGVTAAALGHVRGAGRGSSASRESGPWMHWWAREGSGGQALMSSFSGNVLSDDAALVTEVAPSETAVAGRSLRQLAWRRLKKDKVAMAGGVVVVLLCLLAIFAPLISKLLGIDPYDFNTNLLDPVQRFSARHRRHQRRPLAGHRAGQRPRHPGPASSYGAADLADHRDRRDRAVRRHRRHPRAPSPATPVAGSTRSSAARWTSCWRSRCCCSRSRSWSSWGRWTTSSVHRRQRGADQPADLHHRLLQLGVHRPRHARPGAVAAREGVRRRLAQPRRAQQPDHRRASCCPTSSRRSSSTPR